MTQSLSILEEVKKYAAKSRTKKHRIRTIYLKLRHLDRFMDWSDLVLLNSIIEALVDLKLPYSKQEIYSAFRCVDAEDYERSFRREIFKNLLNNAKNKSVFNN